MSSDTEAGRAAKAEHIRRLLREEGDAISQNAKHLNSQRYDAVADLGDEYEPLRTRAREIKEDAIERLPELIDELTESVEANGGNVHLAADAADANAYVQEVCRDADVLVKSKSMTSEEIEVNDALWEVGCEPVETDLGELVIQIAQEEPSHLVGPGLHKSRREIADLFNTYFDLDEPLETAEELTNFARDHLIERFAEADVGMTGANFVVAETGSIAIVTNEGNARKTVESTDTHIAVAGVEKIIPELADLAPFVELIGRAGTGQATTAYTSILSPPVNSPAVEADAPEDREFHLVLIDNGRTEMREDEHLRETLYCIRCGACANVCANFQHVGGHAFGGETYTGGIATGWEAGVHGLDSAGEFNELCTGTKRCVPACPVKIDIPWINAVVRDRVNRGADPGAFDHLVDGLAPDDDPAGVDRQKRFFGNVETVAKLASAFAPLSNALARTTPAAVVMERVFGVDRRRELPAFRRRTLRDWFDARGGSAVDPAGADREAVLYPDLYTNYVNVERGKAAVRTLEALGVAVRIPAAPESGRAALSQGMIATASGKASDVYAALAEHVDAGRDVVAIEPSDLAMFRDDYERFLPETSFERLSSNSYEIMEYVYGLLENGADAGALRSDGTELVYHSHCQQRSLGLEAYTTAVLEELGYDVETTDAECCGMAGSFGYKSQYYDLAMDVGEDVKRQIEGAYAGRLPVASGTSCTDQIDALVGDRPTHPVEVIAPE